MSSDLLEEKNSASCLLNMAAEEDVIDATVNPITNIIILYYLASLTLFAPIEYPISTYPAYYKPEVKKSQVYKIVAQTTEASVASTEINAANNV